MRRGSPLRAFKDGVKGFFKNGLMSFASVCILTSCLIIMGSAMLIVANLNQFVVQMQQQNEIVVFIDETATEAEVTAMGEELDEIPNISELTFVSKTEALEEYKELFQEQAVLFDSLDENNPLRDSYHLKVVDLELYSQTVNDIEQLDNVANVRVSQGIIEQLINLRQSISMIGIWVTVVLLFVSLFIISNTIRVAIFSRRTEINIMKFVGATDNFIRAPFVVEGLLIGLISCAIAFGVQYYVYNGVIVPMIDQIALFTPIPFHDIVYYVLGGFAVFSVIMGVFGSIIPMRKHLHV